MSESMPFCRLQNTGLNGSSWFHDPTRNQWDPSHEPDAWQCNSIEATVNKINLPIYVNDIKLQVFQVGMKKKSNITL